MRTGAHPTKAELAILRVLWMLGPSTVRDVHSELSKAKPTGLTSVLKTMQIMADKGLVDRDSLRRPQVFRATFTEDRTQKTLVADLIQRAYGGSVQALVLHAIGAKRPSKEEISAIEAVLERLKQTAR